MCLLAMRRSRGQPRETLRPRGPRLSINFICINSINVFRPHGIDASWMTTGEPWYHVDNDSRPERTTPHGGLIFPGVLNLREVSAATGGFVAVPKSHLLYGRRRGFVDDDDAGKSEEAGRYLDLIEFDNFLDSEPNARTGNTVHTQPILVCHEQRGCLTIWDPRLVHCSTSALLPAEANARAREPRLLRLASFLSLCPRAWASEAALAERVRLAEERTCLNSAIPYACLRKRNFQSLAFYEGLWNDAEAMRLLGAG